MTRYFTFLRAINVGGHTVKMDKLRLVFEAMGFKDVETFIASGNVIFSTSSKTASDIEKKVEDELKKQLGFEAITFLRTGEELSRIASYKAFAPAVIQAATAYNIAFLKNPLERTQASALSSLKTGIDDFAVNDREIYWLCQKKQSESTFSNAVLEKKLGVKSTLRGANTVVSMVEKFIIKAV